MTAKIDEHSEMHISSSELAAGERFLCPTDNTYHYEWIAFIAAFLSTIALIPQVIQVIKKKNADQISYLWLFIALTAAVGWATFGIINGVRAEIVSGLFLALLYSILIGLKAYFSRREEKNLPKTE